MLPQTKLTISRRKRSVRLEMTSSPHSRYGHHFPSSCGFFLYPLPRHLNQSFGFSHLQNNPLLVSLSRAMARDLIQRNRTITLVVAVATLTSNILCSALFQQLPDDPFHLARNLGWYLHFANVLSVFGFIGALRVSTRSCHLEFETRESERRDTEDAVLTDAGTRPQCSDLRELPHPRYHPLLHPPLPRPRSSALFLLGPMFAFFLVADRIPDLPLRFLAQPILTIHDLHLLPLVLDPRPPLPER